MRDSQPLPPEAVLAAESPAAALAPAGPSLTHRVGKGVAWLMFQTLGTKAATLLGTIILTWFLDKDDFALIGMINTITAFTNVLQQAGQREILIQRQAHFSRWANPAFWMAFLAGIASMLLMMAIAPVVPLAFHHDTRLVPMMLIAALCAPIDSLGAVPNAKLQSELRFGTITTVGLVTAVLTLGLQALLASPLVGIGAYAFILPRPLMSVITTITYWRASPVKIRRNPQFRRWKYMLGDSGALLGIAAAGAVSMYGDNLTVGLVCTEDALGIYYFSYNFAFQTLQMLIGNLQSAIFPALSQMVNDPVRQVNAFLRAARVSALLGCFACLLQAYLAPAIIHLFFAPKWYPAIPVYQVLSLAMALNALCGPVISLFKAQGRFGLLLRYQMCISTLFIIFVVAGAFMGQALGVAFALLILNFLSTPITLTLAVRPAGMRFRNVRKYLVAPLGLATLAAAPAIGIDYALRALHVYSNFLLLACAGIVCVSLCGLVLALWQPWAWHELRSRLGRILRARRSLQ